jgi:diadenosine tetraphosphate (Ap4A) HIT family hydrolase
MVDYPSSTPEHTCIFCEIVAGKIPASIFWQDEEFMAFLSIYPSTPGNTVVIPKAHYGSDVLALPDDVLSRLILAAKKVANILLAHFEDVGRVGVIMEGTGIDHAHIKLLPMHSTGHMKQGIRKQYLSGKEEYFTQYPGYLSSADGPAAAIENIVALADQLKSAQ